MCCGRYTFVFSTLQYSTDRYVSPRFSRYQDQLKERTLLSWLASTPDMFSCFFSRLSFTQAYTRFIAVPVISYLPYQCLSITASE